MKTSLIALVALLVGILAGMWLESGTTNKKGI